MHNSLTWQSLPSLLLIPLLAGVISQAEAAEIWDVILQLPEDQDEIPMPRHLHSAADRMALWAMPVHAPVQ